MWLKFIKLLLIINIIFNTISQCHAIFNESDNSLGCLYQSVKELGNDCRLLQVYNQIEMDKLTPDQLSELVNYCACKLANMNWEDAYDDHPSTRSVDLMVRRDINNITHHNATYPPVFWSDMDVILKGYSIYISTKDYFLKVAQDSSWAPASTREMRSNAWRDIRIVCHKVARDKWNMYQYLENLQRMDPLTFFKLLDVNRIVDLIYQASKACKMLIYHRFKEFKLKPDTRNFYAVDKIDLRDNELDGFNLVQDNDIDATLKDSSLFLMRCHHWQKRRLEVDELQQECPMMVADTTPSEWIQRHPLPSARAELALKCGCQLLLHNSSWAQLMEDEHIKIMSQALTQYMSAHRVETFTSETPLYSMFAWFTETMQNFERNRRLSVKEIIKLKRKDRDPTDPINHLTGDEEHAIELLRLGCNRLMFNHKKGAQNGEEEASDMRLIRYLDNLRFISQDPMFVFHLTLQDNNLFKLHALSKMCQPVIN